MKERLISIALTVVLAVSMILSPMSITVLADDSAEGVNLIDTNFAEDDVCMRISYRSEYRDGATYTSTYAMGEDETSKYLVVFDARIATGVERLRVRLMGNDATLVNGSPLPYASIDDNWARYTASFMSKSESNFEINFSGSGDMGRSDYYVDNLYLFDRSNGDPVVGTDINLLTGTTEALDLNGEVGAFSAYNRAGGDTESTVKFDVMAKTGTVGPLANADPAAGEIKIVSFVDWDPEVEAQYKVNGIMINRDSDFIGTAAGATEEGLRNYALQYGGSHVTDFMINVFSRVSVFPSQVATDYPEKYSLTSEAGVSVDYTEVPNIKVAHELFVEKNIDFIDIWCDAFREVNINPWLSFRMNDVHHLADIPYSSHSHFYYDNPQIRRVQYGSVVNAYWNNAMDYKHELVRNYILSIINEALSRYDCYGIELDWQRDMFLWHNGGEYNGLDILNDFMRDVDSLLSIYETKYGHDIKLNVRVASDIQTNYDFGLDVITWAAEGLIDVVNPTSRAETTDYNIPVRMWASIMHPYGVEVAAGIEQITVTGGGSLNSQNLELMAAFAASAYSQGADKIYTYNYFRPYNDPFRPANRVGINVKDTEAYQYKGMWNVLTTIGSLEKLMRVNRRMVLTFNDAYAPWSARANRILPITTMANVTTTIRMPIGDIPEGADVTLKFGVNKFNEGDEHPLVYINSMKAEYLTTVANGDALTTQNLVCYKVPDAARDDGYLVIEIIPDSYFKMEHIEIYVDAND